jgi:formylglycine-generating enzyme required for sulfatase activity/energy-coupling factor transporter ATP-binding protein EcfA2
MSRQEDLEQSIRESYDIIRQYEAILCTSDRPEEKARARRLIREQWALVEGYLAEYRSVIGGALPDEMAQMAARFSSLAELSATEQAMAETRERLRSVLGEDQLAQALAPLRQKQSSLRAQLWGGGTMAQDHSVAAGAGGVAVGGDASGPIIVAQEGATVVVGEAPVAVTAVDRESALGHYLRHVISRNRYLQLQGIRSGGRLVHIELEQIYVTLRATRQREARAVPDGVAPDQVGYEEAWLEAEARLAPGEARAHVETVTVAVDEALGAHPRLVVLGDPGSGKTTLLRYLALLYARDRAEGTACVRERLRLDEAGRLPILLPLRRLGAYLRARRPVDDGTEGHKLLLDHLYECLAAERVSLPGDFFDLYLEEGQAVVLLDGLDEVADPDLRRRVSRLVEAFTAAYPACRYVVASRIVGYSGPARLGEGYATTTVREFAMADVERFLCNWHLAVAVGQMGPGESAVAYAEGQTRQLLAAIRANERVRDLAINPLMLTVIALVHRDRVKLPDRRAELYGEAVDVLLGKWDEARGVQERAVLEDRPFDAGDKRLMLQAAALWMQERQANQIEAADLRALLEQRFLSALGDERAAGRAVDRFLEVIQERAGLLGEHGLGVYRFSHLTFQEYLAALAVAGRDDYVEYTLARAGDSWWREVILLEAGHLSTQSRERTTRLVRAIADREEEPEPHYNLVLAADCLRDVGVGRVEGDLLGRVRGRLRTELETPSPRGTLASVRAWLQRRMTVQDWTLRRVAAAQALARIQGASYWTLPYGVPEWVEIPAGEFWMGGEEFSDERPVHRVRLDTFYISRVPITNAQYRLFVEAAGHKPPEDWEEGRPPRGTESHPVVNVSWHDAMAYCEWLGRQLQVPGSRLQVWRNGQLEALNLGPGTWTVRLPSEAEWEKAARGDRDRRAYPWGDTFDANRCNSYELRLGDTTPVGIFSDGASPYGVLDMAGNVWEWTHSVYKDYPYDPGDGREDRGAEGARVVRGGAFNDLAGYVRCAFRDGTSLISGTGLAVFV